MKGEYYITREQGKDQDNLKVEKITADFPDFEEAEKLILTLAEEAGLKAVSNTYYEDDKHRRAWWFLDDGFVTPEGRGFEDIEALHDLNWKPETQPIVEIDLMTLGIVERT